MSIEANTTKCASRVVSFAAMLATAVGAACGPAPQAYETQTEAQTQCPGPATREGIDVSEWQGGIDWNAVAASGRAYAIARVSDGFYQDPTFDGNWAGIRAAGMVRGVYQFFRPTQDAVGQADLLIRHIGALQPGDLPPALDVEVTDGASPAAMNDAIHAWVNEIQARLNVRPIIYVGSYFWDGNVGTTDFSSYPLWLPAYGPYCPRLPNAWGSWIIHQYSSTGAVPGIGGNVDLDRFDGTAADLATLAQGVHCDPHCEGNVVVGSDCGRGDCGVFGATCYQDGGGPRCIVLPRGNLDRATCATIDGWAQDPNTADQAENVDLYFDGPAGSGARAVRISAPNHRDDLCSAIGSCNHGFSYVTPLDLRDGRDHTVYAYAISTTGGPINPQIGGSPLHFHCPIPLAGDFDGDGRTDLLQYRSDWGSVPVCRSLVSGWTCENLTANYVGGIGAGNNGTAIWNGGAPMLADFNGDHRVDLVQFADTWESAPVCLSLGTGWSCENLLANYVGGLAAGNAGDGVFTGGRGLVGDFNGDGRADLIQFDDQWQSIPLCLSLGTGWSCRNLPATFDGGGPAGNAGSGIYPGGVPLVGDFDGDGRDDVAMFAPEWTTLPVCRSLGTGWSCRDLPATFASGGTVDHGATPLVLDFNGDGRDDIAAYADGSDSIPVCLSLVDGWSCRMLAAHFVGDATAAGNNGSGVFHGGIPLVGDFDGDGRQDIAQFSSGWSSIPVCLSVDGGWTCKNLPAAFTGGGSAGNQGSGIFATSAPIVGDFDGDGRTDIAQYQSEQWSTIPVCRSLGTGWSCANLAANYAGGIGAGNSGSGIY